MFLCALLNRIAHNTALSAVDKKRTNMFYIRVYDRTVFPSNCNVKLSLILKKILAFVKRVNQLRLKMTIIQKAPNFTL